MGHAMADTLDQAQAHFRELGNYQVTLRSVAADGDRQEIRYFFQPPGWVRMEFVQPHRGLVMIYDPGARRVRLWPFGVNAVPPLSFSPDNPLLRNPRGHRIDHSDVGALLAHLSALRTQGRLSPLGEANIGARPAIGLEVSGNAGITEAGVHRYRVWLARDLLFPLKVESFGLNGGLIESVDMSDAETGITFPERFFTP